MKYEPMECWGFAWSNSKPRPYITSITAYARKDCQNQAEETIGLPWKKIYRMGGRAVRCILAPKVRRHSGQTTGD